MATEPGNIFKVTKNRRQRRSDTEMQLKDVIICQQVFFLETRLTAVPLLSTKRGCLYIYSLLPISQSHKKAAGEWNGTSRRSGVMKKKGFHRMNKDGRTKSLLCRFSLWTHQVSLLLVSPLSSFGVDFQSGKL